MRFSTRLFDSATEMYQREVGNDDYRTEIELLRTLPQKFKSGVWEWSDVESVVKWKSSQALSDFRGNDKETVVETVEEVRTTDSICGAVEYLRDLDGVQVPMASSVLLFMEPEEYTVIDTRAWNALREFGYVSGDYDNESVEQYLIYLGACRTLATEYDVELRTLDRALWVFGR